MIVPFCAKESLYTVFALLLLTCVISMSVIQRLQPCFSNILPMIMFLKCNLFQWQVIVNYFFYFVLRFWQVSDQKPLSTWTVKQGQTFSCPAIYNSQTKEYVAISDSKVRQTKVSGPTTVVKVTTNIFCNLQVLQVASLFLC